MGDVWIEYEIKTQPRDFIREAHRKGVTWATACDEWIVRHRPRNPQYDLQARMEERLSQEIDLCRYQLCSLLTSQGDARADAWARDMVSVESDTCIDKNITGRLDPDNLPDEIVFMGGAKIIQVRSGDTVRWEKA